LEAGAKLFPLTSKILFIPKIESMEEFEEAISDNGIDVCTIILDSFWKHLDLDYIQSLTDWKPLRPKYWEYIRGVSGESNPENPQMAFYRYYKFLSDYLRGEHLRFDGSKNGEAKRLRAKEKYIDRMMDNTTVD
jgi:hypothetical protein